MSSNWEEEGFHKVADCGHPKCHDLGPPPKPADNNGWGFCWWCMIDVPINSCEDFDRARSRSSGD